MASDAALLALTKRAALAALLGFLLFHFWWRSTLLMGEHVGLKSHEFDPLLYQFAVLDITALDQGVDHRGGEAVGLPEEFLQTAPLTNERTRRHDLDAEFFDELVDVLKRLHLRSFALGRFYRQLVYVMSCSKLPKAG
jgi:hypothetical protein